MGSIIHFLKLLGAAIILLSTTGNASEFRRSGSPDRPKSSAQERGKGIMASSKGNSHGQSTKNVQGTGVVRKLKTAASGKDLAQGEWKPKFDRSFSGNLPEPPMPTNPVGKDGQAIFDKTDESIAKGSSKKTFQLSDSMKLKEPKWRAVFESLKPNEEGKINLENNQLGRLSSVIPGSQFKGWITYEQFLRYMVEIDKEDSPENKKDMKAAFLVFNKSGKGITYEDMVSTMKVLGWREKLISREKFDTFDKNGDGKLDFNEFCLIMDQPIQQAGPSRGK